MTDNKNKFINFFSWLKMSPGTARTILIISVLAAGLILSLMRDARRDETRYLHDVATMADYISHGEWFGNEDVGWHGFILKVPTAILFLIFGKSVFIATLTTLVFALLSCWLAFRILKQLLKSDWWALAGIWLIVTNYHFVLSVPTLLREIPFLFVSLLFFDSIINKRNKWVIGLLLLLILDTKEGVFFAFAPPFVVWVALEEWFLKLECRGLRTENREQKTESQMQTQNLEFQAPNAKNQEPTTSSIHQRINPSTHFLSNTFTRLFAGLFPAFVFLILMFCTSIIPLNMRNANILGITTAGMHDMKYNFSPHRAAKHRKVKKKIVQFKAPEKTKFYKKPDKKVAKNQKVKKRIIQFKASEKTKSYKKPDKKIEKSIVTSKNFSQKKISENNIKISLFSKIKENFNRVFRSLYYYFIIFLNSFLLYFSKIFHYRAFTFLSIPKIILFPAIFCSVSCFVQWWRERKTNLIGLTLFLWFYLIIYTVRISNGRYLIPVLPIIIFFFIKFLKTKLESQTFPKWIFGFTLLAIISGFYFEEKYLTIKICINFILVTMLFLLFYTNYKNWKIVKIIPAFFIATLGIICMIVALASSLLLPGQIGGYLNFGYNRQTKQILEQFPKDERIWFNSIGSGRLTYFHRNERPQSAECFWRLQKWVPKKKLLHDNKNLRTFSYKYRRPARFKCRIEQNNISSLGLIVSQLPDFKFRNQDQLDNFMQFDWLELRKSVAFKNKTLYIFDVVSTNGVNAGMHNN